MAFNISYIFYAIDQFTAPAKQISESISLIGHNIDKVSEKLKKQSEAVKKFGESFSLYVSAPIIAAGVYSLKAFNDSEQAMAQVNLALKTTGNAAGFTGDQLKGMADKLEENSLFKHTDVLRNVSLQLLKFKDISGSVFTQTQQDIIDYAARTGKPLQEASMVIGKAIGDPEHGILRLSRIGVVLTDAQRKVIDTLVKQGHVVKAQQYLLKRIHELYKDAAITAADTGTGGITRLLNQLDQIAEQVGKAINTVISPALPYIQKFIDYLKALDPQTKHYILVIAGFLAIAGPLIVVLGVLGIALSAVGRGIGLFFNPITMVIIAFSALAIIMYEAYKHGDALNYMLAALTASLIGVVIAFRFSLGPISWVIGAIQLLTLAAIYCYGHFKRFHEIINQVGKNFLETFYVAETIVDGLILTIGKLIEVMGKIPGFGGFTKVGQDIEAYAQQQLGVDSDGRQKNQLANIASLTSDSANKVHAAHNPKSTVDVNIHLQDREGIVKHVKVNKTGGGSVNVGRNMSGV